MWTIPVLKTFIAAALLLVLCDVTPTYPAGYDSANILSVAIVGAEAFDFADTGLSEGATFFYRVLTLSGGDRTGYSNETAATTPRAASLAASGSGGGGCFIATAAGKLGFPEEGRARAIGLCAALLVIVLVVWEKTRQNHRQPVIIDSSRRPDREETDSGLTPG